MFLDAVGFVQGFVLSTSGQTHKKTSADATVFSPCDVRRTTQHNLSYGCRIFVCVGKFKFNNNLIRRRHLINAFTFWDPHVEYRQCPTFGTRIKMSLLVQVPCTIVP
jgi:hypothetical protein